MKNLDGKTPGAPLARIGVFLLGMLMSPSAWALVNCPAGTVNGNCLEIKTDPPVATSSYPFEIGRPFVQGEIAQCPQIKLNGTPILTQADVKNRWPDGSVKLAAITAVLPSLSGTPAVITFQNQPCSNTGLTAAQMLSPAFDFDAVIELTADGVNGPVTAQVSARDLLAAGHFTYWKQGPVATEVIIADHTTARSGDIGFRRTDHTQVVADQYTFVSTPAQQSPTPQQIQQMQALVKVANATGIQVGQLLDIGRYGERVQVTQTNTAVTPHELQVIRNVTNDPIVTRNLYHLYYKPQDWIGTTTWRLPASPAEHAQFDSARGIFHATFFHTINKVEVRHLIENANTESAQDQRFTLALKQGLAPTTVYTKPDFRLKFGSRATKTFWLNGAPPTVAIDHNLRYLTATTMLANFESGTPIPANVITSACQEWLAAAKDLGDWGVWPFSQGFNSGGTRDDQGPGLNLWSIRGLKSGNRCLTEEMLVNTELKADWPFHYREGQLGKRLNRGDTNPNSGLGEVLSGTNRPTFWARRIHFGGTPWTYTVPSDRINERSVAAFFDTKGVYSDAEHRDAAFYPEYLVTGDYFFLEELRFWHAFGTLDIATGTAPGTAPYPWSRGPDGSYGGFGGSNTRADARTMANRNNAIAAEPDGSDYGVYAKRLLYDHIAQQMGQRNITYQLNDPIYPAADWTLNLAWGATHHPNYGIYSDPTAIPMTPAFGYASPLGYWEVGADWSSYWLSPNPTQFMYNLDLSVTRHSQGKFMNGYLGSALGRAAEFVPAMEPLKEFVCNHYWIPQLTIAGYDPIHLLDYQGPITRYGPGGTGYAYFQTHTEALQGLNSIPQAVNHAYFDIAQEGVNYCASEGSQGQAAYQAWEQLLQSHNRPVASMDPRWAILPRGAAQNNPLSPTPTVSLTAVPSSINPGQSSTLLWASTSATSCTASGGWSGSKPTAGTEVVSPTATTSYSLTCTNGGGNSASTVTTVTVGGSTGSQPPGNGTTPATGYQVTLLWGSHSAMVSNGENQTVAVLPGTTVTLRMQATPGTTPSADDVLILVYSTMREPRQTIALPAPINATIPPTYINPLNAFVVTQHTGVEFANQAIITETRVAGPETQNTVLTGLRVHRNPNGTYEIANVGNFTVWY